MKPNKPPVPAKIAYVVISLLLAVSQMGCATNSPKQDVELPPLPLPPSLSTPLPSVSYSSRAAESERNSRERLMGTRLMSSTTGTSGPEAPR